MYHLSHKLGFKKKKKKKLDFLCFLFLVNYIWEILHVKKKNCQHKVNIHLLLRNTEEKTEKTISSVDSVEQQSVYSVVIMLMMSLLVPEEPPASEYIRNAVKVNGCKILG